MSFQFEQFDQALRLLSGRLALAQAPPYNLVVCGGTALVAAAVDQMGSYHAIDLQALEPTDEELLAAAAWTRTHDPSEGYLQSLRWFLKEFGYERVAARL